MTEKVPLRALNVAREPNMRQAFACMNLNAGRRDSTWARSNIENQPPRLDGAKKLVVKSSQSQPVLSSQEKSQIRNVDEYDHDKPQYCSEYVENIQEIYFSTEDDFIVPPNYLEGRPILPKHRAILVDRMISLHCQFRCAPEVLHLLINFIDRYLVCKPKLRKSDLHLVGVTALFVASKVEEITTPVIDNLVAVTDNECSKDQILRMERDMLVTLNFRLIFPHTLLFLRRMSKVGGVTAQVHMIAKYAIELAYLETTMISMKPSKLAAAALFLGMRVMDHLAIWDSTLQHYSRYQKEDLSDISQMMFTLITRAPSHHLRAVYLKYAHRKCNAIAQSFKLRSFKMEILLT